MRCKRALELFASSWGSGAPLPGRLRRHLDRCSECARESRRIRGALETASTLASPDPGDAYWREFLPRVRARIDASRSAEATAGRGTQTFRGLRWAVPAAVAAVLLLAAAVSLLWRFESGSARSTARLTSIENRLDEGIMKAGDEDRLQVRDFLSGTAGEVSLSGTEPSMDPNALMSAVGDVAGALSPLGTPTWPDAGELIDSISPEEAAALIKELRAAGKTPEAGTQEGTTG